MALVHLENKVVPFFTPLVREPPRGGRRATGTRTEHWQLEPAVWRRVIEVNLTGSYLTCRSAVPHMVAKGFGRIVNIASVAGKELATTGVLVDAITPAAAMTPIFDSMKPEHIQFMLSKIPMGRILQVDEAAAMIAWLASEECAFSTGAVSDLSGSRTTY